MISSTLFIIQHFVKLSTASWALAPGLAQKNTPGGENLSGVKTCYGFLQGGSHNPP
jgi:hypothetical protein